MKRILIGFLTAAFAIPVCQPQGKIKSPVVNPDKSVTFTLHAPDADDVLLKGTCINRKNGVAMRRNGGEWTFTTRPLPSELYTYFFEVDDEKLLDPGNPDVVRDIADSLNYFVIEGGIADDYVRRNVAHGKVEKVWYPTKIDGMDRRRMTVYLPAVYQKQNNKRFPVLYLLHGSGGDENSWGDNGRAFEILDNMIAAGYCTPMIVVMPNGNVDLAAAPGEDPEHPEVKPKANNMTSMLGGIESVFVDDVVTYVDSHYRTKADKAHRAIAGLSLGGLHARFISMNNPDGFDYIGLFSPQTTNKLDETPAESLSKTLGGIWRGIKDSVPFIKGSGIDRTLSKFTLTNLDIYDYEDLKMSKQFKSPPALYYIAKGQDDNLIGDMVNELIEKMDAYGFPYYYKETDGGHTWENWRKYLVDFLPRLFR